MFEEGPRLPRPLRDCQSDAGTLSVRRGGVRVCRSAEAVQHLMGEPVRGENSRAVPEEMPHGVTVADKVSLACRASSLSGGEALGSVQRRRSTQGSTPLGQRTPEAVPEESGTPDSQSAETFPRSFRIQRSGSADSLASMVRCCRLQIDSGLD